MSMSVELARYGAAVAYEDATSPIIYGFEPFSKSMAYPVNRTLKEVEDRVLIGVFMPRFSWVNREVSDHFLDIKPLMIEICQYPPTRERRAGFARQKRLPGSPEQCFL